MRETLGSASAKGDVCLPPTLRSMADTCGGADHQISLTKVERIGDMATGFHHLTPPPFPDGLHKGAHAEGRSSIPLMFCRGVSSWGRT